MKFRYALLFLVFSLHGCEFGQESLPSDAATVSESTSTIAIEDLSNRLGVSADEIRLVSQKSITWRDGSLGCPKEGMMYKQALVEGTLIVLRANGKAYEYHSARGRSPFYCENPKKPAATPSLD